MHLARNDQVDRIGPAFVHLQHPLGRYAASSQIPLGAFRRQNAKAQLVEAAGDRQHRRFVVIIHRHEDRAFQRQTAFRRDLRFRERHSEAVGESHGLAGRPHFGPQHGIYAGQFGEGEDGLFHGYPGDGKLIGKAQIVQCLPHNDRRRELCERYACGLAHKRHGPGRPGIDLQDVDHAVLDGVLHVEQADNPERLGKLLRVPPHFLDLPIADQVRRQHARRVAGMHAGVLDVLHDPTDDAAGAVCNSVDVGLERVFQKAVDEHRVFRRDARGFHEVLAQRAVVVDDLHRAPAEHVGGAHEHGIPDALCDTHRFLDRAGDPVRRLCDAEPARELFEPLAVLGDVDRVR